MKELIERLYPICRSITGDGVRETLRIMSEQVPLQTFEVATGTKVFDWTIPREWNVEQAYVESLDGERLIDFSAHNLHLISYSTPMRAELSRAELLTHIVTDPNHPNWIPYRTSYYNDHWGFCTRHADLDRFTDDSYRVVVDSTLTNGALSYGELVIPGSSRQEVLIYSHICHPSLCNDNLSGIAVTLALAEALESRTSRYTYRFVWAPGTIGSIAWLAGHEDIVRYIKHGLVAVLLGDSGRFHYKRSRRSDTDIDRIAQHLLADREARILDFDPYGYDERQFCSPGFNLPVGRLTRSPNGSYPEYHTSADNLDFVSKENLDESLALLLEIVDALENNRRYVNLQPMCEPQLGRRGLFRKQGGTDLPDYEASLLWSLNMSDGSAGLLDIAERSGISINSLGVAAADLTNAGLLEEVPLHKET